MPYSPFTRLLGLAIVAAYAVALLWPDPEVQIMGWHAMVALPLVIGLFTWSAIRDAPVFDDRAFHRTLPRTDAQAFVKTILIHATVLFGIALAVIGYCWIFNFGWQAMSLGIVMLTAPLWGFMALCAIAITVSTSNQYGKTWAYIAMFVVPVFSLTVIYFIRHHIDPELIRRGYYLGDLRTMTVVGAVLFPLNWWLVAVKRRAVLGLVLGMAVAAMMPWIYVYGGFFEAPDRRVNPYDQVEISRVSVTRKPNLPATGKWIPIGDLLNVEGLREDQYLNLWSICLKEGPDPFIATFEVPDDSSQGETGVAHSGLVAHRSSDGTVSWGKRHVFDYLKRQVSSVENLEYWNQVPSHLAVIRPGESAMIGPRKEEMNFKPHLFQPAISEERFTNSPWEARYGMVFQLEKRGAVDASRGGTVRVPEGGVLQVDRIQEKNDSYFISLRYYFQDLWQADGPWFEPKSIEGYWGQEPWVIAVDESGKRAFAFNATGEHSEHVMLGMVSSWRIQLGKTETPDDAKRLESLRKCRLHVFWPKLISRLKSEIPFES